MDSHMKEAARLNFKQKREGLTMQQYLQGNLSIIINKMSQGESMPAQVINAARGELSTVVVSGLTNMATHHGTMDEFVNGAYEGLIAYEKDRFSSLQKVLNKARDYLDDY